MQNITFKQIMQGFVGLLLLIVFVWLAFYALVILLVIAAAATIYFLVRRLLIKQGIISPKYDEPPESEAQVTIIETEYSDVTEEKKDDPR